MVDEGGSPPTLNYLKIPEKKPALRRGKWNWSGLRRAIDPGDLRGLGPLTGALPIFGAECRFTAAFRTQGQAVSKVAV